MLPISYWSRHLEFRMASDVELEEIIVAVRSLNETLDSLVKYGRGAVRGMSQCFIDFYPLSATLCFNPFPKKPWVRIHQPFSRTFFVFVSNICKLECNTNSDWLNRMV